MHLFRTHTCGQLRSSDASKTVKLSGWIHKKRDHGGILFIDLRDHYGITQVLVNPSSDFFENAESTKLESVITITGVVLIRSETNVNSKLDTGEIEVSVTSFLLESASQQLPFPISHETAIPEESRLKYRYLDLRHQRMHENIVFRSKMLKLIRDFFHERAFLEIQTPILTSSSPEGARDYIVPSRLYPGKFYALPQAPQQFKQLLMISGFDKYFQIAPCFRDEDSRADRSPGEFYQVDIEMSYVTEDDVFLLIEDFLSKIVASLSEKKIQQLPFSRITYKDAMDKYGTDKPDIRYELEQVDVTSIFANTKIKVFKDVIAQQGVVKAINVKGISDKSRKFFDDAEQFAKDEGAKGLAWIAYKENGLVGPLAKFISDDERMALRSMLKFDLGDVLFFGAGEKNATCALLGKIRGYFARELQLIDNNLLSFCWIVDFPMFEWKEDEKKIDFSHNPFSMPKGGLQGLRSQNPLDVVGQQYDIVCNGIELSSGAIRNHDPEVMEEAFKIAGYDKSTLLTKFPALWNAFQFGAPPHGGIAPGLDRLIMLLRDEPNIREVIAFPLNQKAQDLLMNAPSDLTEKQLKECHIKISKVE